MGHAEALRGWLGADARDLLVDCERGSERRERASQLSLALDDNEREEAYLVELEEQGLIGVSSAREDEEERIASERTLALELLKDRLVGLVSDRHDGAMARKLRRAERWRARSSSAIGGEASEGPEQPGNERRVAGDEGAGVRAGAGQRARLCADP